MKEKLYIKYKPDKRRKDEILIEVILVGATMAYGSKLYEVEPVRGFGRIKVREIIKK